jgi:hypothetical protein
LKKLLKGENYEEILENLKKTSLNIKNGKWLFEKKMKKMLGRW